MQLFRETSSLEDGERVILKGKDNYCDSYFFAGNVVDNYLNFAGMCWRIVRIAGDNSIEIILEDQNATCDNSEFKRNWNIGRVHYGSFFNDEGYIN